jgi:hypothetical protein
MSDYKNTMNLKSFGDAVDHRYPPMGLDHERYTVYKDAEFLIDDATFNVLMAEFERKNLKKVANILNRYRSRQNGNGERCLELDASLLLGYLIYLRSMVSYAWSGITRRV